MLKKITDNLFYIFIFFLPWQTVYIAREIFIDGEKFQYGTIGFYLFEAILFIWIVLNLKKIPRCNEKRLIYFLSFFSLYLILSIFWSADKLLALNFLIANLLGILTFLIIQSSALNFKKFSFSLISSVSLSSILGLCQFFTQSTFASKYLGLSNHFSWQGGTAVIETTAGRFLRLYGSMPHPNIMGGLLTIALLLSLGAYFKAQKNELRWKSFLVLTIPLNFTALIFTFSRGALITLILGAAFLIFYFLFLEKVPKKKDIMVVFYAIIILFSIIFVAYPEIFSSRTQVDSRLEKKSISDRQTYLTESQQIISHHPILGVGLGNYTENVLENKKIQKEIWNIQPVHNLYLLVFSEIGLVGFCLLFFLVVYNLTEFPHLIQQRNTNRIIFSVILINILLISLLDHWFWTMPVGIILFWIIFGFSREKDLHCI